MAIIEACTIVVALDADGGLRISPTGGLVQAAVGSLDEAILAGLRSGAPRIEVDLRAVTQWDQEAIRALDAGRRLAQHLSIELRVTGHDLLGIGAALR